MKTLGVYMAKEIWARISMQMNLWDRGLHAGLVGGAEAERASREGRAASGGEEEDKVILRSYHDTALLGKLREAIRRATNRKGGVSFPE